MGFDVNSLLDAAAISVESINPKHKQLALYGFSVMNSADVLGNQSGSGYYDMQVVDSALTSGNHKEMPNGDGIYRLPNLMTFELPMFFRAAFIIATLNLNSNYETSYNRLSLDYDYGSRTSIAIASTTGSSGRKQVQLVGFYGGLAFTEPDQHARFVIETYGSQQYLSASVLVGALL